jgi:hypothetical protein
VRKDQLRLAANAREKCGIIPLTNPIKRKSKTI